VPRIARVVVPGVPHHLTQRGNRSGPVFFSDADRTRYLELLGEYASRTGFEVLAYCLMTNHVHLVVVPERKDSLAMAFKPLNLRYAVHINRAQGWRGRLWQERFYTCPLDPPHCLRAARYVELNPIRAKLVGRPADYLWSSAQGHLGQRTDPLLSDRQGHLSSVPSWSEWLQVGETPDESKLLRLHTRTGRPLGGQGFVARIEERLGRVVRARPRGRPPKSRPEAEDGGR